MPSQWVDITPDPKNLATAVSPDLVDDTWYVGRVLRGGGIRVVELASSPSASSRQDGDGNPVGVYGAFIFKTASATPIWAWTQAGIASARVQIDLLPTD